MLALLSASVIVHALVWLIVVGLIFWLLNWLLDYVGVPQPFAKAARVILGVAAVVLVINLLLGIAGSPFIGW